MHFMSIQPYSLSPCRLHGAKTSAHSIAVAVNYSLLNLFSSARRTSSCLQ